MKSQIAFTVLLVAAVTTEAQDAKNTASGLRTAKVQGDTSQVGRELRPIEVFPNPTVEGAWGHCQGDCDIDDDCYHNLICFHRQENMGTIVPGCKGGDLDFTATDYCVFPGDIPLSGNLFEQHTGDHLNDESSQSGTPGDTTDRENTIINIEDPDGDTATDPPLQLVKASGVLPLNQGFILMALVSVVSAATLSFGA